MNNNNANLTWRNLVSDIVKYGSRTSPRGMPVLEMMGYQTKIWMKYPIVTMIERKLGYKFLAAEAAWILSGDNRVASITPFSKDIANFSDDGFRFFGAYGPKIMDQISSVAKALVKDPSSRQAVINIWRENPPETKDVPCTISVQWLIRDGHLHCFDTMRSSDAWLGWPYDIFNFTMLSGYLALMLRRFGIDIELGVLTLTAGSQHLYERNLESVKEVLASQVTPPGYGGFRPLEWFESPEELPMFLWSAANNQGALEEFRKIGAL